jgi:predicted phosphodiesterase
MSGRIFVCGDTHGMTRDTQKLNGRNFPEQKNLTKEDVLIQLGDFGWVWYALGANKEQEYWLDWLAGKKYTLAVVLGNHENYNIIEELPLEEKWCNQVRVLKRNTGCIYFLKRGGVYTINDKKILAIGGAESTDKSSRIENVSWWEQEKLTNKETKSCLDEIDKHGKVYDYVLTHTCPTKFVNRFTSNLMKAKCSVAAFLEHVNDVVECREWHFGHFHRDKALPDGKYRCHYESPPFELGVDGEISIVKEPEESIDDVTYFGLKVYTIEGCGKCVRMSDIKTLPFYEIWCEKSFGSTVGISEDYGAMVYLYDWEKFSKLYI